MTQRSLIRDANTVSASKKWLKVAFLGGPANAREIYREWTECKGQFYFGTDYLKQFLQLASDLGATSYVITWHGDKREIFQMGDFTFDNRPITTAAGAKYYLDQLHWHIALWPTLFRFRPDILMLTGNQNFWWVLAPVRWLGAKVVISYHAVLWPQFQPVKRSWRFLLQLNRIFILRHAKAILSTSRDICRQIETLLGRGKNGVPILDHLPSYQPSQFAEIRVPRRSRPFRVIFAARIEANKGVFDVLEMARRLPDVQFDICGTGGALDAAKAQAPENVTFHGFCDSQRMVKVMSEAHIAVVPTRSTFEAGFEMTCAEAILAGRPLVTSKVCPALDYMREASVEAVPDDAPSYRDAIVALRDDPKLYAEKQAACAGLQQQFYDPDNSWYAKMRIALEKYALAPTDSR